MSSRDSYMSQSSSSECSISDDGENRIEDEDREWSHSDGETKENHVERTDIKEQVYQDKLSSILKQIQQLEDGTHEDYVRQLKKLELEQNNQLMTNHLWRDCLLEMIEREFTKEHYLALKEFEDRSRELSKNLITELNERKKAIKIDHFYMELCPELADQRPSMTRKLRRRPNDPVVPVVIQEKRCKLSPVTNICYTLKEREIEYDLKVIQEVLVSLPITSTSATSDVKPSGTFSFTSNQKPIESYLISLPSSSNENTSLDKSQKLDSEESSITTDSKIVDGKLLFEKRWYHRGQPVFVEGRKIAKFPAIISAIGSETIWVKKTSDNSKFRINLFYLSKGKMSIKRRAAV